MHNFLDDTFSSSQKETRTTLNRPETGLKKIMNPRLVTAKLGFLRSKGCKLRKRKGHYRRSAAHPIPRQGGWDGNGFSSTPSSHTYMDNPLTS